MNKFNRFLYNLSLDELKAIKKEIDNKIYKKQRITVVEKILKLNKLNNKNLYNYLLNRWSLYDFIITEPKIIR